MWMLVLREETQNTAPESRGLVYSRLVTPGNFSTICPIVHYPTYYRYTTAHLFTL